MRGGKAIIGSIYNIPEKPAGDYIGSPGGKPNPDKGAGDEDGGDNGSGDGDDTFPPGVGDDGGMKGRCSFFNPNAPHAKSGQQPIGTEIDECSLITGEGPPDTYGDGSGNKGIISWGGRKSRRKKRTKKRKYKKRGTKKVRRKSKKRIRKNSKKKRSNI